MRWRSRAAIETTWRRKTKGTAATGMMKMIGVLRASEVGPLKVLPGTSPVTTSAAAAGLTAKITAVTA
jgi:hypothetical protein